MVKRILVTTALEKTWPSVDKKIIFLGEWCKLYERKQIWEQYDHIIASYHWDDRGKLEKDYMFLKSLYESTLRELAKKLNSIHEVSFSLRYWRIIVGPWLGYFIQILFDRWFSINHTLAFYNIDKVYVIDRKLDDSPSNDFGEFCKLMVEDDWNEMIYTQILFDSKISLNLIDSKNYVEKFKNVQPLETNEKKRVKYKIYNFVKYIIKRLSKNDKYFLISTYLNSKSYYFFEILLGQFPKNWKSIQFQNFQINAESRKWNLNIPVLQEGQEFIKILEKFIPLHLPKVYLEGFKIAQQNCEASLWPKSPKIIFTSNSYSTDDFFKIWTASKIENGATLIIGQHGGNYGMARWSFTEEHEIEISDYFITWGWKNVDIKKIHPLGILKLFGQKISKNTSKSKGLLVELILPRYSYMLCSFPVGIGQWEKYLEEQYKFVSYLPNNIQEKLLVRLNQGDYDIGQIKRWKEAYPEINIDDGYSSMANLLLDTKIFISTYNATTYLESFAMNLPTLIFWNPKFWELREGVQPFFDILKEVGIFHETPESAAEQTAKIWDDVEGWWFDPKTQYARLKFCENFANLPENPLNKLANIFKSVI